METRDLFRERIGFISYMAALAHVDEEESRADWNDESQYTTDCHKDAAEAVYAQALRDVYAYARCVTAGYMGAGSVYRHIEKFAARRGIDLD